ncbi:CII family transcriptional regulator, partial [Gallibacterium anatis]
MARNELSKSAMRIADLIRRKSVEKTDKEIAERIGVDPSTFCRFKADHLEKFCAFLDELGLVVKEKYADDAERKALITLAKKA